MGALPGLHTPPKHINILGHSLGAAAAAQLAACLPLEGGSLGALQRGHLILSAPFLNIEAMAQAIFCKIRGLTEWRKTPPAWILWPLVVHHWDNTVQVRNAVRAG